MADTLDPINPVKNISYLCARDPSIISWGGIKGHSKKNLDSALGEVTVASSIEPDVSKIKTSTSQFLNCFLLFVIQSDTVSTYLRIKTTKTDDGLYQILDSQTIQCRIPEGSHAIRHAKEGDNITKKYTFTKIFSGNASQSDLFNEINKPKLLKFLNGYNYTLLSYGASGSGELILYEFTVITDLLSLFCR